MLISEQTEPYNDAGSIFELKLDGIRCIAYLDSHSTDLRNKRDFCLLPRFPELSNLHNYCQTKCILDGELNLLVNGKPDFYELQKRTLLTDAFKIHLASQRFPANFAAFDILYFKDHAVMDLPLMERKRLLSMAVTETSSLSVSRSIEKNGISMFELVKQQQLEGIVGKKKESLYWMGKRTREWKKIKWMKDEDFICLGYLPKQEHRHSLILAKLRSDGEFELTGHVTLGVSLRKLWERGLTTTDCPLPSVPKGYENAVWLTPFVCTVQFMPSKTGGMRQPVFKGIRDDKGINDCL